VRQQRSGEPARPRTDLENGHAVERSSRAGDAAGEIEVEQEILSK
jgi:hypothetical protein